MDYFDRYNITSGYKRKRNKSNRKFKDMATKEMKKSAIIECTINWAFLNEPSGKPGQEKFKFDASNLSEADQEKLVGIGLGSALQDDDHDAKAKRWKREGKFSAEDIAAKLESMPHKGTFIIPKSKIKDAKWRDDEDDIRWFTVSMADKGPVDLASIGNGTKALVKIEAIPYKAGADYPAGISAGLSKVVITELVKYERSDDVDDAEMYIRAAEMSKASAKEDMAAETEDEGFDTSE